MKHLALLLALVLALPTGADTVRLRDGSTVIGNIRRTAEGWVLITEDGTIRHLKHDEVTSVQLGSTAATRPSVQRDLESLRRSVEALSDLSQIIDKYQRFIDALPEGETQTLAEANQDLAQWRDRQSAGLVKYAGQWVKPAELPRLHSQTLAQLRDAGRLISQGRHDEAQPILNRLLDADRRNPTAHYLRGVLSHDANQLAAARKAFEATDDAAPGHAPTLNNLAVIHWKQNNPLAALTFLQQAMRADGQNQPVLDNVAEALGSLPEEHREKPVARRTYEQFVDLDQALQKQQEAQGLFRWGSGWVKQQELDQLKAAEQRIVEQLADMEKEFEQTKQDVQRADEEIEAVERSLRRLEAQSYVRDEKGRLLRRRLPNLYYELQADRDELIAQRETLFRRLDTMQQQAVRVRSQLPRPKFTGRLAVLGVEHAPVLPPPSAPEPPPTRPASRPVAEEGKS